MVPSQFQKPLLPSHYSVWVDPPDEAGDEVLNIVSERRSIRLKGHSFREFRKAVIPLLDGRHTLGEIQEATRDVFRPEDLLQGLQLLATQGVLVEAGVNSVPPEAASRMAPQLNFFHDMAPNVDLQSRLAGADVALIGLGGVGAAAALALGAAGVGKLRCIDSLPFAASDIYFAPFLGLAQTGASRAETVVRLLEASAPQTRAVADARTLDSEEDLRGAIQGADFVVCCLDAAQSNLTFKLNRVCLADRTRWIACSLAGAEIVVGPAIHPGEGPCYMCYRMRAVACTGNPEAGFAYERYLDRRKQDDSGRRENLVFSAGIAANFLGLEVVKDLTGLAEPSLVGRLMTVRLTDLAVERHTVLRKPWCPACFPAAEAAHAR